LALGRFFNSLAVWKKSKMMLKRNRFWMYGLLLLLLAACGKGGLFTGAKIYQVTNIRTGVITTYTYDGTNGGVSSIVVGNNGKTEIAYNGNNVLVSQINPLGYTISGTSYTLNSSGYADTAEGQLQFQNLRASYQYDVNGMILQQRLYAAGACTEIDFYTNANKNLAQVLHQYQNGTYDYDYYSYLLANGNTIGVQNYGQFYMGVSAANLVLNDVKIDQSGDTTEIISYRYRYNGTDVDTVVSYNRAGQLVDSIAYTYY
jgi:hypothetical protein